VFANALVLGAFVVLLTPFASALFAGGITLVLWFGAAITANLAPAVWLPLAYYRGQAPSWGVAVGLVVLAVGVHVWTCGMTGWAHRQFER
jgi:multisubunit Na+/H+ antiporter MnhG subunit